MPFVLDGYGVRYILCIMWL